MSNWNNLVAKRVSVSSFLETLTRFATSEGSRPATASSLLPLLTQRAMPNTQPCA